MARRRNWLACLLLASALLVGWIAPQGQARRSSTRAPSLSATIEQCANRLGGTTSSVNNCAGIGWVPGNLNVNNSIYRQGDFVPFRTTMGNLVAGRTYALDIGYDAVENGLHAYDFLGSYDASAFPGQQIVPCFGVANTAGQHACGHDPSTLEIPADTNTTFPDGSHPPPQSGNFSVWGGTLQGAVYTNTTPIGPATSDKVQRTMRISFVADGPNAVLAWGGHIASALVWGAARTYTSVYGGAPFHMRLGGQFCEVGGDCSTTGNQDLSLHAAALAPVPGLSTQVVPPAATIDQSVVDTATLTGVSGSGAVTGSVEFFVCFNQTSEPNCNQGGTSIGFQNVVLGAGSNNGTASMEFRADQETGGQGAGFYCFRVEYTPAPDALYAPALHTNTTSECFQATLPPPLLTVTKLCDPQDDPGLFNLLLDGFPVPNGTNVPCGGSRGPFETTAGSHTVSESAGTGTNLGNYTSEFGGDCAPAGLLTLELGDSAVCTITNTRLPSPPPASLTVHKVCVPADDPGNFEILVNDAPVAILSCPESSQPIALEPGDYTVREAGGEDTSLSDYTTVISGDCAADGSITLVSGQSASCTFTNTRTPPTTTLRVDKVCDPAGDDGRFNLLIATIGGTPVHRVTVGCGGTTGVVHVAPGQYVVRERGAGNTHLSDYDRFVGGDCGFDGTVAVEAGDQLTCQITNVRKGTQPVPAELTVTKLCVPEDDGGRFNLTVDGQTEHDVACGQSFGPVAVAPGTHQVSESAGTGTSLADYTTTIGGACASDGSVTLVAGEQATCSITNVRKGEPPEPPQQTGTVEIQKQCSPAGTQGNFQVELDEQVFRVACGESTGPVEIEVGDHRVGEVVALDNNTTGLFATTIGGDCAPDGSFTLSAGEHVVCVVTNTAGPIEPPVQPPSACYTLSASPRTATVGKRVRVVARIHVGRRPVPGVRVYLRGPGVSAIATTGRTGRAVFVVTPRRRGMLRVSIRKAFDCPARPPKNIGISAAATPPITG